MTLEGHCESLRDSVEGVLLCGVVDREERRVLAARGAGAVTPELEASLVEATLELLAQPRAELLALERGQPTPPFGEIQVTDERTRYFVKLLRDGRRAVVLVTHKETSAGLGWAQLKALAAQLEQPES